jgi:hypothetical protein
MGFPFKILAENGYRGHHTLLIYIVAEGYNEFFVRFGGNDDDYLVNIGGIFT